MVENADVVVFAIELEGRSGLHCFFYIILSKSNKLVEVFIEGDQNEL